MEDCKNYDAHVGYWLACLQAHVPRANVIIVGMKIDLLASDGDWEKDVVRDEMNTFVDAQLKTFPQDSRVRLVGSRVHKQCDAEESYREHLFPCSRRSDGRVFWLCEKHTSESLRKKYDLEVVEGRDGRRSSGGEEKERGSSDDDVPVKSSGPRMCVVS